MAALDSLVFNMYATTKNQPGTPCRITASLISLQLPKTPSFPKTR